MYSYWDCGTTAASTYTPVDTKEEPLLEASILKQNNNDYPGIGLRHIIPSFGPPPNKTLIKTGGNALQAVNTSELVQPNVVTVSVPEYKNPGEQLRVMAADGSGRIVTAIIPEGCTAGHSFLVQFPDFVPYTDELKLEEEETKSDDRIREII